MRVGGLNAIKYSNKNWLSPLNKPTEKSKLFNKNYRNYLCIIYISAVDS